MKGLKLNLIKQDIFSWEKKRLDIHETFQEAMRLGDKKVSQFHDWDFIRASYDKIKWLGCLNTFNLDSSSSYLCGTELVSKKVA